jgi:large repetitive protein
VISNTARVTFDTNPPIDTPTWSNTIDSSTPTSQVAQLPVAESSPHFQVHWSGTDNFSGISDFTIYVSVNGGPFTPWIDTSDTSATYMGQPGNTYSFYSLAKSNVGNVENAKTFADATTTVLRPTALSYSGPTSGHYGDAVTLSATLTDTSLTPASGVSGVPVTLSLGTQSCTGTTDTTGTATCSVTLSQTPGSVNVRVSFAGNSTYLPTTSPPTAFTISTATTTTSLSSAPDPSVYGQQVTFTATITPTDGRGTTAFYADGSATPLSGCGTVPLTQAAGSPWTATCTTSALPVGSHAVTVSYSGDTDYAGSSGSLAGGQTVNPAPTTTSLASSSDPSGYSSPVTFTATVTPVDGGGTVAFYADASATPVSGCGTVPLIQVTGGTWTAMCTTAALPAGSHTVSASYSGDSSYVGSAGNLAGGQKVKPAPLTITASGGSMTYGATPPAITPAYSGFVGGEGPGSLITPPACSTAATSASPVGTYPSSCSGAADANYAISYVGGQVTVSQAGTTLAYTGPLSASSGASLTPAAALSSPASACQAGQPVSFALNVNPATAAAGPYSLGSATTNGSGAAAGAPVSTAGWLAGAYIITASYAGTANCGAATATAPLAVTVPGLAAAGAGRYSITGVGPVKFGFIVAKIPHTSIYLGGISLVEDGAWRLTGIVSGYVKTASAQGTVTGTGSLSWWNPALNNHHGGWQLAGNAVAFSVSFSATTSTSPGTFGIHISYTPVSPQPATLPNSSPLTLQSGIIAMA